MMKREEALERYQRGYAEVDLDAIAANMQNMKRRIAAGT